MAESGLDNLWSANDIFGTTVVSKIMLDTYNNGEFELTKLQWKSLKE